MLNPRETIFTIPIYLKSSLCEAIQIMYDRRHTVKNYPKKDAETLKRFRDKHFLPHTMRLQDLIEIAYNAKS